MKRHEAIAPLSRDHHGSLMLAQLLKLNAPKYPGLPDNAKDKARYAQQQFKDHIKKHFQLEEMMLEKAKDINHSIKNLAEEIKTDHNQLCRLFQSLDATNGLEDKMNTLAVVLEKHILKEERILFPLLQQHCSEALLQEIHELLH
jgi:iron-sulfur cluster repair protein YtfE (RIC family)